MSMPREYSAIEQAPTVGRQVHYVFENGEVRPATVVRVWGPETVNLQVLLDGANDRGLGGTDLVWKTSVVYDEGGTSLLGVDGPLQYRGNSWHWPPRA